MKKIPTTMVSWSLSLSLGRDANMVLWRLYEFVSVMKTIFQVSMESYRVVIGLN